MSANQACEARRAGTKRDVVDLGLDCTQQVFPYRSPEVVHGETARLLALRAQDSRLSTRRRQSHAAVEGDHRVRHPGHRLPLPAGGQRHQPPRGRGSVARDAATRELPVLRVSQVPRGDLSAGARDLGRSGTYRASPDPDLQERSARGLAEELSADRQRYPRPREALAVPVLRGDVINQALCSSSTTA